MDGQDEHFIDPNEVDIIEAFAAHAATCTPDQLQASEEALGLVARGVGSSRSTRDSKSRRGLSEGMGSAREDWMLGPRIRGRVAENQTHSQRRV